MKEKNIEKYAREIVKNEDYYKARIYNIKKINEQHETKRNNTSQPSWENISLQKNLASLKYFYIVFRK